MDFTRGAGSSEERDTIAVEGVLKKNGDKHGSGVLGIRSATGRFRGRRGRVRLDVQNPKRWRSVGGGD